MICDEAGSQWSDRKTSDDVSKELREPEASGYQPEHKCESEPCRNRRNQGSLVWNAAIIRLV